MLQEFAIKLLRFCAWCSLIGGIVLAIAIWANTSQRFKPGYLSIVETNPNDIIYGFILLALGVFGFAFFLVVCSIADNLIAIRKNQAQHPPAANSDPLIDLLKQGGASD